MVIDFNNIDLVAISTKAAGAVESLLVNPPYTNYDSEALEVARSTLTT